jgi:serine/threonine protein kinase
MGDFTKNEGDLRARAAADSRPVANPTVLLTELAVHEPDSVAEPRLWGDSEVLRALSARYEILADAGRGSMGNVYKARDRETGGIVALKLLKPEIASDQGMIDRFKNELLFARKITHKNVCRVYEFNRVNGVAYTSMEFVEGESLRAVLNRDRKLPAKQATEFALQMCSGLNEAHAQGIVHRDLKPENVMIDSRGSVKIMDFGIARSMDAATRRTGSLAGTPAYMAPEQVAGKPVDYRTDIYSLGLMLYEMFTGVPAFRAENSVAVALKQMREDPIPPHTIEPAISVSIERAILKCLEKEPDRRFLSVGELQATLEAPASERTDLPPVNAPRAATAKGEVPTGLNSKLSKTPRRRVVSPFVWALLGAGVVLGAVGGEKVLAIQSAAENAVFNEKFGTPVPPGFAYEIPAPAVARPTVLPPANKPKAKAVADKITTPKPATNSETQRAEPTVLGRPEVFPRMETGPLKRKFESQEVARSVGDPIASASSSGMEYLWVGRFEKYDAAEKKAQAVKKMNLGTLILPRHTDNKLFFVLLVGPVQSKKEAATTDSLEAKGFLNVHPVLSSAVADKGRK